MDREHGQADYKHGVVTRQFTHVHMPSRKDASDSVVHNACLARQRKSVFEQFREIGATGNLLTTARIRTIVNLLYSSGLQRLVTPAYSENFHFAVAGYLCDLHETVARVLQSINSMVGTSGVIRISKVDIGDDIFS
jgi:hypothetical protein